MTTYEQHGIDGGAKTVTVRPWKPGELKPQRVRMPALGSLKRLRKAEARMLAGRDAAGGWDAYFDSGGMAGPYGHEKPKPLAQVVSIEDRIVRTAEPVAAPDASDGWEYAIDRAEGGTCSARGCEEPATWWTSCTDLSGQYRPTRRRVCDEHAARFEEKRGIERKVG